MERFLEIIKAFFLGIIEGITEWLPISSTGHMLLFDEVLKLKASEEFKELFFIFIQFGAILAVLLLFWEKMWPFQKGIAKENQKEMFSLWMKVILACIPGAIVTLLLDDFINSHFHTPIIIAAALILYGFAFLFLERKNLKKARLKESLAEISYQDAFFIGLFQVLSIIPGTSRSGSTILGALILGISRSAAAEFTFFLAVPVMAGYSLLKLLKFGFCFALSEILLLLIGSASAFLTSLFVIRFFINFVKKHSFAAFGIYRILLGAIVLLYFLF